MKLCNFLNFDPNYNGVALSAASMMDKAVWEEFSDDRTSLSAVAKAIRANFKNKNIANSYEVFKSVEEDEFPEGKILTLTHRVRERNRTVVNNKKQKALSEKGYLRCEACNFDFLKFYGPVGEGFIECHHTVPVSKLDEKSKTKLKDLSLVCANCHRMLHVTRPWMSIKELKILITKKIEIEGG
jgi:5-methylcytosine-specific restriction protein A